jgi:hypothetical protein
MLFFYNRHNALHVAPKATVWNSTRIATAPFWELFSTLESIVASYSITIHNVKGSAHDEILPCEYFGINNNGEAVGVCWPLLSLVYYKGSGATLKLLKVGNAIETNGYGINDDGMIVGRYVRGETPNLPQRIFGFSCRSIDDTSSQSIDGGQAIGDCEVYSINSSGLIAGSRYYQQANVFYCEPFTYDKAGKYTKLGGPFPKDIIRFLGINDSGVMVGLYNENNIGRAIRCIKGAFTNLHIPGPSCALGINNHGHIVGWYTKDDSQRPFLLVNEVLEDIDIGVSATDVRIHAINDHGEIVGCYSDSGGSYGFTGTPTSARKAPEVVNLTLE